MSADDMCAADEKARTSARPTGSSRIDSVSVSVNILRRRFARKADICALRLMNDGAAITAHR